MPYFVRVGHIPSNIGRVGSRGYHLQRKGRDVIATWGPVQVHANRRVQWCRTPTKKTYRHCSEAAAKSEMKKRVRKRIEQEGYDRLYARILAP